MNLGVREWVLFAAAVAAMATAAHAQQLDGAWRDPEGRLTLSYPQGWTVRERASDTPGAVRVFVGSGDYECQVWSLPTPETLHDTPEVNKQRYAHPRTTQRWHDMVTPLNYFSGNQVQVSDQTVDTSGVWPVEHVILAGGAQTVRGTFQGRPGLELLSLCTSFDDQDRNTTFAQIERSIDGTATPAP